MLQMRVYSERTSTINGIMTSVGEDAHPFINDAGMFVADGMGGGAGVPILRFDERCFDEDTLSRMLCDYFNFNSAAAKDEFCVYSKENFSSLSNPVMKKLYSSPKENTLRLKKSAYVGSHVLGAVFAAMLIQLSSSDNYSQMDIFSWKEIVEKFKNSMFEQYKKVISVLGSEYAKVSYDKIDYYGTTMAGVFFKENEDSVDAIFLNCGDSRSYVWDLNGFRQACDDQGRNGGMTSGFSLGKDVKVEISCEVRNYKKPCSIFCMTDGFYGVFRGKNGFHSTPLYMEGFLMNVLSTQLSIEDATSRLKTIFDTKGQIDDSNSMVMASFGYKTYEELKEAAKSRMDYINREYCLSNMPDDFLLVDYKKIVSDLQKASADRIKPLLTEAYNDEGVHSYCLTQIAQTLNGTTKYRQKIRTIDDEIAAVKKRNDDISKTLYVVAKENFTDFQDIENVGQSILTRLKNNVQGTRLKDAMFYGREFSEYYHFRAGAIDGLIEELVLLNNRIKDKTDSITLDIKSPWTKCTEEETLAWVKTTRDDIRESFKRLQDKLSNIVEYSKGITDDCEKWKQINIKLMNDYLDKGGIISPQRIVDSWLKNALVIEEAIDTTIPSVRLAIIELVKQYQKNLEEIEQLNIEREQAVEQAARNYWEDNSYRDIYKLLKNSMYFKSSSLLKQQMIEILNQNEELAKYENLSQIQSEVFEQYLKIHLSETSEDKISDVKKNGWL